MSKKNRKNAIVESTVEKTTLETNEKCEFVSQQHISKATNTGTITNFIFGKNYKFFEITENGSKKYYIANGAETLGKNIDKYHEIDVYSKGLNKVIHKLIDIETLPLRYRTNFRDCDIYLPDISNLFSNIKSLNGSIYLLSPSTSQSFVHPIDKRDFISLSTICDSTNTYALSSTEKINSYLFNKVEDVIQNSDRLTSYNDFSEFVRLNTQMNQIYQFFCKKYTDIVNYITKKQNFEGELSTIVFSEYFSYLEELDEVQESEDIRFAKLVINSFLTTIAGNDFNSSMSWEEHSKALRSIFEKVISQYVNSETIPTLIDGIDVILHEVYEAVLSTEVEDALDVDYTGTNGNVYGDNYDINYSYQSVLDNVNKTYVTDQLCSTNIQNTYPDVIKSKISTCLSELDRIEEERSSISASFLNAIHNRYIGIGSTNGCKQAFTEFVNNNFNNGSIYNKVLIMYAQYHTSSGCPFCWSTTDSAMTKKIDTLMTDILNVYYQYANIYDKTQNYLKSGTDFKFTKLNTSKLYNTTNIYGDSDYIVASKRLPYKNDDGFTGEWATYKYYGQNYDIKSNLIDLSGEIDYLKVKYTSSRLLETNEKTIIKKGTLAAVEEVVKGHEQWEDSLSTHEFDNRFDVSTVVNISDEFYYYCANGERLCAWATLCSTYPDNLSDIQKTFCDSTIKIDAYELTSPDLCSISQYYFYGILQTDVDDDNLMTPIKQSYANIFNRISAFSYNTKGVSWDYMTAAEQKEYKKTKNTSRFIPTIRSYTDETINDFEVFKGATTKAVDMYKDGGNYTCQICCIYPPGEKYKIWKDMKDTPLSANTLKGYQNFYEHLGEEQYSSISAGDSRFKEIINELIDGSDEVKQNADTITVEEILSSYAKSKGISYEQQLVTSSADREKFHKMVVSDLYVYSNNISASSVLGNMLSTLLYDQFKIFDTIADSLPSFLKDKKKGQFWYVIRNTAWLKDHYPNLYAKSTYNSLTSYIAKNEDENRNLQSLANECLCTFIDADEFTGYNFNNFKNNTMWDMLPTDGDPETSLTVIGELEILYDNNNFPIYDVTPENGYPLYDDESYTVIDENRSRIAGWKYDGLTSIGDNKLYKYQYSTTKGGLNTFTCINSQNKALSSIEYTDGAGYTYGYYDSETPYGIFLNDDATLTYAFKQGGDTTQIVRNYSFDTDCYASSYSKYEGMQYDIPFNQVSNVYVNDDGYICYGLVDGIADFTTCLKSNGTIYATDDLGKHIFKQPLSIFGRIVYNGLYEAIKGIGQYNTSSKPFYPVITAWIENCNYDLTATNRSSRVENTKCKIVDFEDKLFTNPLDLSNGSNVLSVNFYTTNTKSPLYQLDGILDEPLSINMLTNIITLEYRDKVAGETKTPRQKIEKSDIKQLSANTSVVLKKYISKGDNNVYFYKNNNNQSYFELITGNVNHEGELGTDTQAYCYLKMTGTLPDPSKNKLESVEDFKLRDDGYLVPKDSEYNQMTSLTGWASGGYDVNGILNVTYSTTVVEGYHIDDSETKVLDSSKQYTIPLTSIVGNNYYSSSYSSIVKWYTSLKKNTQYTFKLEKDFIKDGVIIRTESLSLTKDIITGVKEQESQYGRNITLTLVPPDSTETIDLKLCTQESDKRFKIAISIQFQYYYNSDTESYEYKYYSIGTYLADDAGISLVDSGNVYTITIFKLSIDYSQYITGYTTLASKEPKSITFYSPIWLRNVTVLSPAYGFSSGVDFYNSDKNKYLSKIQTDTAGKLIGEWDIEPAYKYYTTEDGVVVEGQHLFGIKCGSNNTIYYCFYGEKEIVNYKLKNNKLKNYDFYVCIQDKLAAPHTELVNKMEEVFQGTITINDVEYTKKYVDKTTVNPLTNQAVWDRISYRNFINAFKDPDYTLNSPIWQVLSSYITRWNNMDELLTDTTTSFTYYMRYRLQDPIDSNLVKSFAEYSEQYASLLIPYIDIKSGLIDLRYTYKPVIDIYCTYGNSTHGWLTLNEDYETIVEKDYSTNDTNKNTNSIKEVLQTGKVWISEKQQLKDSADSFVTLDTSSNSTGKMVRVNAKIIRISVKNAIALDQFRKSAELVIKTVDFDFNESNPNSWVNVSAYAYPTGSAMRLSTLTELYPILEDGSKGVNPPELVRIVNQLSADVRTNKRKLIDGCYEEINSDPHPTISWYDSTGTEQSINAELSVVGKYNNKSPAKSTYYIWYNTASENYRLDDYASKMSQVLSANSNSILNIYQNYPYLYNIVVESIAKYFSSEFIKDRIFEHFSNVYYDMLEEIDYDIDTSYTSYYDLEGNEINQDDDKMYQDNSKISYLYDSLKDKYQQYLTDSNSIKQKLNELQSNSLCSYYSRLSHKYLSSESILNYAVKAEINQNVLESTLSDYTRTGFLKYANYDKLQKTAIEIIDAYHQDFKEDLDLEKQNEIFLTTLSDYNEFKFSDVEIKNLRQPISVYNINDEGYYMSSIVKGYDIDPNTVSSLYCDDDGFIIYQLSGSGANITSTYKVLGTNMEFDSRMNQIYTVSSYVNSSYQNLSTFSEILLDNYSEISDKVYFDLKDEIVDNITELALCAVLGTWEYLNQKCGEDFEFKYYYEYFLSTQQSDFNTSIITEDAVDTWDTASFRNSLNVYNASYTKESGFWDVSLDYTSDLKWDKVGDTSWCKRYFPDEYKIWDHTCNHTAKQSVSQAIKGFRYAKLLLFFKNNIHQYVQNIMDQGYLRDSLNIINNALIVEIGKLLTTKIASNETYQRTIFLSVATDVANYTFTNGRNYNENSIKTKFKQQFKKNLFELNNVGVEEIRNILTEKIKENVSKVNDKYYSDVNDNIQNSFSQLISEAYNNIPYKLDISTLIQDGNLKENLAQYTTYLLNTSEYVNDILSGCSSIEQQNSTTYSALSTVVNSTVDSKIGRQISNDYYSTQRISTNPYYTYDLNFVKNIKNGYNSTLTDNASQVTSFCESKFVSLNEMLSVRYNQLLHEVVDQHLDLLSSHHIISEVVKIRSVLSNLTYNYMIEVPLNRQCMQLRDGCLDVNAAITKVPYDWNYSINMTDEYNFMNLRDYHSINVCGNTVYLKYKPNKKITAVLCSDLLSSDISVYDMSNVQSTSESSSNADHIEVLKSIDAEVENYAKHRTNVYSIDITNSKIGDSNTKQKIKNKINMIVEQLMPMNTQIYDIRFDS